MRLAATLALVLMSTPALAGWFDKDTVHFNPTAKLTDLYMQGPTDPAPVKVTDIIKQPPHVGFDKGPALQLPQQFDTTKLTSTTRDIKIYDLNNDAVLDRSELTAGLLAWAVTSRQGVPFAKVQFFAGTMPIDRFILNYDDTAYVRRTVVQHGRVGSLDLLDVLAR